MFFTKLIKFIDLTLSLSFFFLLSPIFICLVFTNFLFLGSPIFFISKRIGIHGNHFNLFKFRSMKIKLNVEDPDLISGYGKIIRRMSIDELPQLINILKGDMSLIGPRPLPESIENTINNLKRNKRRVIKPGITGYSQIRYSGKKRSLDEKVDLDIYFIDNLNMTIYLKVLFLTPIAILKRFIFNKKGSTL